MKRALRAMAWLAILGAVAWAPVGCSWNYLYPGHSMESDEKWQADWDERDKATREMPLSLDQGPKGTNEDWNALFPGAD